MSRISKEKQKATLKKMKGRRYDDMVFLREISKQKLDWAIAEKQKGLEQIQKYQKEIKNLELQVVRLDGYIVAMREINTVKKDSPNADNTN